MRRHLPLIVAAVAGFGAGFLLRSLIAISDSVSIAVASVIGAVVLAAVTDLTAGGIRTAGRRLAGIVTGRLPGHRRLHPRRLAQTRVLPHVAGTHYGGERWVDLTELDHRGYFYGVAQSPTYVPLYGNGLVHLRRIEIAERAPAALPAPVEELIDEEVARLRAENLESARPFSDGPLLRLVRWAPPVDQDGSLRLMTEAVGHHRYAAANALLRRDDGRLRRAYGVEVRDLDNPVVCGCLGVEVAVVTSDEQLVLARRGDAGGDYRNETVVSIGEALHPGHDRRAEGAPIDPFAAVTRGARDELGIEIDGHRTRFLALGLEITRMDPDLLGYVRVDQTADEVRAAFLAGHPRDRWETANVAFCAFTPTAVAGLLADGSRARLTPATPMNLVFALSDCFGEKVVEKALTR